MYITQCNSTWASTVLKTVGTTTGTHESNPHNFCTLTPNLALPWMLLIKSEEVSAALAATSNAPAPGTTLPSSMAFFTALKPSRTASLI